MKSFTKSCKETAPPGEQLYCTRKYSGPDVKVYVRVSKSILDNYYVHVIRIFVNVIVI